MCDYDDYDGDPVHDMWVDDSYEYEMWTGENVTGNDDSCFQEQPTSYFIASSQEEKPQSAIEIYQSYISSDKARLLQIEIEIEQIESQLKNPHLSHKRMSRLQKMLAAQREQQVSCAEMLRRHEDRLKTSLVEADIKAVKSGNHTVVGCCVATLLLAFILFWCIY